MTSHPRSSIIKLESTIYEDGVIAVALVSSSVDNGLNLAIKYLKPESYRDEEGRLVDTTNVMGGETDWFIVPFSLAIGIARMLIEQKAAGLASFREEGFSRMLKWLVDVEELKDAMCY